jgi:hypothetical protein
MVKKTQSWRLWLNKILMLGKFLNTSGFVNPWTGVLNGMWCVAAVTSMFLKLESTLELRNKKLGA